MAPVHATVSCLTNRATVGRAYGGQKAKWIILHAHRRVCAARLTRQLIHLPYALLVQAERLYPAEMHAAMEFGFMKL